MEEKKAFHLDEDNVAIPEIHSEEFEELQKKVDEEENKEREEMEIVYDNVAIPEIHIHHKKK